MPALEIWTIKTWGEKTAKSAKLTHWQTHDLHLCCKHGFQDCKVMWGYFITCIRSHRFWELDGSLTVLYSTNILTCRQHGSSQGGCEIDSLAPSTNTSKESASGTLGYSPGSRVYACLSGGCKGSSSQLWSLTCPVTMRSSGSSQRDVHV